MAAEPGNAALRLAARFQPLFRSGERLVLASEDEIRLIEQPVLADAIEALHQGSDTCDLIRTLESRYAPEEIAVAVQQLKEAGLLGKPAKLGIGPSAYWDSVGCDPPHGTISFQSYCRYGNELIAQALESNGLKLSDSAEFLLVTVDDYLRPELAEINRRKTPWLLAKPVGHTIWLGPLFVPGETACWECLARWLKPHRWLQAAFSGWEGKAYPPQPSIAALGTTIGLAAGMIVTAASVWSAQGRFPSLENAVMTFDTRTLQSSSSTLRARPDCPRCKAPARSAPASFHEFISPITGVVSQLEVTDEPVLGLYHARALFLSPLPSAKALRDLPNWHYSVGKAPTREIAETICLAESLERYSLVHQGGEAAVRARLQDVAGVSPDDILLFSQAQYQTRESWNPQHGDFQWVPERFDPAEKVEWTEAHSLANGSSRLVPTGLCYMYYPFTGGRHFCSPDTNGCAAGASLAEAKLHALLELIERDAVSIWWYNRLRRPSAPLSLFGDSRIRALEAAFTDADRSVYVLDVTTDLEIPVYVAVAPRRDGSEPAFAAAASLSPRQAAYKAIAEVAQICFWAPTKSRENDLLTWLRTANTNAAEYLVPCGTAVPAPECDFSPQDALDVCVRRVEAAGIDPLYVDLTRAEIGLPVVRAFAPGLRHFWARFAPGRLYSVPVCMGWGQHSLAEHELNPVPCMI